MFMKHYAPNRCEPSIEVIMKLGVQWGRRGSGGGRGGGQGGCERRSEVIVKIQKQFRGGGREDLVGGGVVRVDVNEELKLL